MNIKRLMVALLMVVALMAGCAQQGVAPGGAGGAGGVGGAGGYGSQSGAGYGNGGNGGAGGYGNNGGNGYGNGAGQYTPADLRNPNSILSQRVIYFGFDHAEILPEYMPVLAAHAALLSANPNLRIRLEGHADERGSREYNVALSERRGYSVQQYLQVKGVNTSQMDVIGYGEEIPAVFGHNEAAWSKNRRVEIKYAGEQ